MGLFDNFKKTDVRSLENLNEPVPAGGFLHIMRPLRRIRSQNAQTAQARGQRTPTPDYANHQINFVGFDHGYQLGRFFPAVLFH